MTDTRARLGAHRATSPCEHCGAWPRKRHARSCPKASKARLAVRFGKDQERRIEERYGPTKVGEFGDAIDHLGRDWKWQAKSSHDDVPIYLDALEGWSGIKPYLWITAPIDHMSALARDLYPLLIRTFVRVGVPAHDFIVVRSNDWAEMHGGPAPDTEFMVMTGAHFLDVNGRDVRKPNPLNDPMGYPAKLSHDEADHD